MSNQIMLPEINLPNGANIVTNEVFYTTTYILNDTYTERIVMDVRGLSVEIIRYNKDNNDVMVWIGNRARGMKMEDVGEYIRKNT